MVEHEMDTVDKVFAILFIVAVTVAMSLLSLVVLAVVQAGVCGW